MAEDGSVAYALGWALFKTGQLSDADRVLKRVKDPALFQQATELRQRVAACRLEGRGCL